MPVYILKRILAGMLTMFILVTITFFLMHAIPGGPFSPAEERNVPESVLKKVEERYGLNDPVYIQYFNYLKNLAHGDLGFSFKQPDRTVNEIIRIGFPVSAKVGAIAAVVSVVIGVPLGIISAVKRGKWMDWASMAFATIGISVPGFVIAVLSMYLFAVKLKILPTYGLTSWRHYILPVGGLALGPIAYIARLMRSSMLEIMRQDYIRTARAKGVSEFWVIAKHAMKNAITPVVTYLGPLVASLLTGSFVVEKLFSIPGMGRYYVTGISDRDYSVTLGMTLFFGLFVVIANIIVDILYALIDPRVKMDE
ncbi:MULTISPECIES: ABC transporter permease [Tepidanaerobacter]|mgnify:CR=1 FL=1|uniref:Oligopeptide transport system permease protein n=1 Tax=Tepidanaerobacter syntrophicus TaxID=224999 RepID=A0A0U9HGS8_9FIRM|nr:MULTISPECIES: ABC transporter permease [Tepidanaerobacter]GAQ26041.1 oligopeptide transport system permease protein [Tepidanaerobacter syntrophicus]GLI19644.1 peptide ABC transporter permease [Tepidanaerobacter syntrophicus]GLI50345.1 peptide ABC transporter permease [Tepidanaerobacter syntrophicus]HHV82372.1 ABC transporter permease [Tepidanaerobacter syntrophicus]